MPKEAIAASPVDTWDDIMGPSTPRAANSEVFLNWIYKWFLPSKHHQSHQSWPHGIHNKEKERERQTFKFFLLFPSTSSRDISSVPTCIHTHCRKVRGLIQMHQKLRKMCFQADGVSKPAEHLRTVRAEPGERTCSGTETGSKMNLEGTHV